MSAAPIYFSTLKTATTRIQNSDGTSLLTLVTPGANGCRIDALSITSSDTVQQTLSFAVTRGGVDYYIGTLIVPASAGQSAAAVPAVDGLNAVAMPWLRTDGAQRLMYLENGAVLRVQSGIVTASKAVHLVAQYADA